MITMYVATGDTLSGIAQQYGTSYQAIASANHISNPDVISVGERLVIPKGGSFSSWTPAQSTPSPTPSAHGGSSGTGSSSPSSSASSSGSSGGSSSGYHIPGVSDATAACIAFRESTNGTATWNVFEITPGSGYTVTPGMSLQQQEQVAGQLAASAGVHQAWGQYDGCS